MKLVQRLWPDITLVAKDFQEYKNITGNKKGE